jgi:hypothetical protein
MASSEQLLLTALSTCFTDHVQPGGGGDEPSPQYPAESVEYHAPPVLMAVASFQHSHEGEPNLHFRCEVAMSE